jgi:hypothetical protein
MGAYGLLAIKGTILIGTAPYLDALARKMTQSEINNVSACSMQTTVTYIDKAGKKRCHGGKDLKKTQAYPLGFGAAHALAFQAHTAAAAASAISAAAVRNALASPVASPAFVDAGTPSPSPAAAAGDSASWADILGDMTDSDEDDGYVQDVKVWMSRTWHNNYKIEHSLPLTQYGPPRDETSAAASEDKGREENKVKLRRGPAKPKAKTAEQTAAARDMKLIASTQEKMRKAIELVKTAAAALLVAGAGEFMPIDTLIHDHLNYLLGELQTADTLDQQVAELTELCRQAAAEVKLANNRIKVLLSAVSKTKRARTT